MIFAVVAKRVSVYVCVVLRCRQGEFQQELDDSKSALEAAEAARDAADTALAAAEQAAAAVRTELDATRDSLRLSVAEVEESRLACSLAGDKLQVAETAGAEMTSELVNLRRTIEEMASEGDSLRGKLQTTEAAGAEMTSELEDLRRAITEITSERENLRSTVADMTTEGDGLRSAVADKTSEKDQLQETVTEMKSEESSLRKSLTELGLQMKAEKARTESAVNEASELRAALESSGKDGAADASAAIAAAGEAATARAAAAEIQGRLDGALQVCSWVAGARCTPGPARAGKGAGLSQYFIRQHASRCLTWPVCLSEGIVVGSIVECCRVGGVALTRLLLAQHDWQIQSRVTAFSDRGWDSRADYFSDGCAYRVSTPFA